MVTFKPEQYLPEIRQLESTFEYNGLKIKKKRKEDTIDESWGHFSTVAVN